MDKDSLSASPSSVEELEDDDEEDEVVERNFSSEERRLSIRRSSFRVRLPIMKRTGDGR